MDNYTRSWDSYTWFCHGVPDWLEEDDSPTNEQLVTGFERAILLWATTLLACENSLKFYAGQVKKYREMLLARLKAEEGYG